MPPLKPIHQCQAPVVVHHTCLLTFQVVCPVCHGSHHMPIEYLSMGVHRFLLQFPDPNTAKQYIDEQFKLAAMVFSDQTIDFYVQRAMFLGRLNKNKQWAQFVGTSLPAAVVVQHHKHFAALAVHQRPNHRMVDLIWSETTLQLPSSVCTQLCGAE